MVLVVASSRCSSNAFPASSTPAICVLAVLRCPISAAGLLSAEGAIPATASGGAGVEATAETEREMPEGAAAAAETEGGVLGGIAVTIVEYTGPGAGIETGAGVVASSGIEATRR